jgi:hypothetical protein
MDIMTIPRELTVAEKKAVSRVEKALAAIPDTIALHFNESGFHVFDREVFNSEAAMCGGAWMEDASSDHRDIRCHYDTGAI